MNMHSYVTKIVDFEIFFSFCKNVDMTDCQLPIEWQRYKDLFLGGHSNKISDLWLKIPGICVKS